MKSYEELKSDIEDNDEIEKIVQNIEDSLKDQIRRKVSPIEFVYVFKCDAGIYDIPEEKYIKVIDICNECGWDARIEKLLRNKKCEVETFYKLRQKTYVMEPCFDMAIVVRQKKE